MGNGIFTIIELFVDNVEICNEISERWTFSSEPLFAGTFVCIRAPIYARKMGVLCLYTCITEVFLAGCFRS